MFQLDRVAREVRTIQPYFTLSTSLNYDIKIMNDSCISHFYSFTADLSDGQVFAIPDASVDILFLCDGNDSKARLCGTTTTARLVEIQKGKRYFGVRFKPGFIPKFVNVEPKNLVDSEYSLCDLFSKSHDLIQKLSVLNDIEDLSSCFIKFFNDHMDRDLSSFGLQIRDLITLSEGDIRIGDLEKYTGYSSRYISKVFVDNFGLSPKSYALIIRFQRVMQRMIIDNRLSLTDLASDEGYADQSHFLREFKRFAAQTPSIFIRTVKEKDNINQLHIGDELIAFRN